MPSPTPLVFINPNADDEDDVFSGADNTNIPLLADLNSSVSIDYNFLSYHSGREEFL